MLKGITGYVRRHHIALLALFLALGGTSVAASNALLPRNSVGTAQLKNGAVTKKKINKKTVRALRGNRGPQGKQGAQGAQGLQGAQGAQGAQGVPGTARAYGLVHILGTQVTRSKGVLSVSHPGVGLYCILIDPSISFSATGAVLSPDYPEDTTGPSAIAHTEVFLALPGDCPAGNYLYVKTFRVTANGTNLVNTPSNQGFFFVVP
jgi:hypothetical protein